MSAIKEKISVSISSPLVKFLEDIAHTEHISKSALVENALENYRHIRLAQDAQKLAQMHFNDLPTEEEWLTIQSEY